MPLPLHPASDMPHGAHRLTPFLALSTKNYANVRLDQNRTYGTASPGVRMGFHNLREIEFEVFCMRQGYRSSSRWQRFLMWLGRCPHKPILFMDCDITEGRPFPIASFTVRYCPICDKFTLHREVAP